MAVAELVVPAQVPGNIRLCRAFDPLTLAGQDVEDRVFSTDRFSVDVTDMNR